MISRRSCPGGRPESGARPHCSKRQADTAGSTDLHRASSRVQRTAGTAELAGRDQLGALLDWILTWVSLEIFCSA